MTLLREAGLEAGAFLVVQADHDAVLILGFLGMVAVAGGVYAPLWMYRPLGGVFAVISSSRRACKCSDGRVLGASSLLDARSLYARISERLNPASPPRAPAERRHCCGPGFMLWKQF